MLSRSRLSRSVRYTLEFAVLCTAVSLVLGSGLAQAGVSLTSFSIDSSGPVTPPVAPATSPTNPANEVIFGSDFETLSPTGTGSVYLSLNADAFVSGPRTVLSKTIYVPHDGWAYLQSDGRYFSSTMPTGGLARTYIMLDGVKISNDSTIDWTGGTHVSQHCFNAIAAAYLTQGYHDISLNAEGQSFYIGAGSNLSLVASAAAQAVVSTLANDAGPYSFSLPSGGLPDGSTVPNFVVTSQYVSTTAGQPIISLASFSETNAGRNGDALLTIYKDGAQPTLSQATWTNNDGYPVIELRAPMYSHAYFDTSGGSSAISLNASLYPWSVNGQPNNVTYQVDKSAQLVSLVGGMTLYGKVLSTWNSPQNESHFGYFWCIGSDQSWPGCPATNTEVKLATTTITVPATHSGEVFFTSKIRMQGDPSDGGGNVFLYLKIDGQPVSSYGVQGITAYDGASQRTLSTSYFTAGGLRLSPGSHTVEAWVKASGSFIHMTASADLPLIYFD